MSERTVADLLAGMIDLAPSGTPPHGPDPCTALCVPACAGPPVDAAGEPLAAEGQDPGPSAPALLAASP
jgi:hypothetical protein